MGVIGNDSGVREIDELWLVIFLLFACLGIFTSFSRIIIISKEPIYLIISSQKHPLLEIVEIFVIVKIGSDC